MPATAPRSAEALSTKPNRVDAYIASEIVRIQRLKDSPATNPANIPHAIIDRINKYAGELHTRERNNDAVNPAFLTENMSLVEVASVLAALGRALAQEMDDRTKDPQWEERVRNLDWKRSVERYAKAGQ